MMAFVRARTRCVPAPHTRVFVPMSLRNTPRAQTLRRWGDALYGDFILLERPGRLERARRVFLGDVTGKDEAWLRNTLFESPEIIPTDDIDSAFGPLVPLCTELRTEA